ncbi:MAG: DUF5694 domain-containing protein [Acidobacteriota bacterium]
MIRSPTTRLTRLGVAVLPLLALVALPSRLSGDDAKHPIDVLILGTYHFANPGQDMVNLEVDDVLSKTRQEEIVALVDSLAEWQPTKIAVENVAIPPHFRLDSFAQARSMLEEVRNETVQIGFRLAQRLGHSSVFGYDERATEGEPDYFPIDRVQGFAAANDQEHVLDDLMAEMTRIVAKEEKALASQSIPESLVNHNSQALVDERHDRFYYTLLSIGDGDQQPGAELNAYWYLRNAKMFAKIDLIAEPGDRVLVIAGSGHSTWLRHFARHTPGYRLTDALPYVERAARQIRDQRGRD